MFEKLEEMAIRKIENNYAYWKEKIKTKSGLKKAGAWFHKDYSGDEDVVRKKMLRCILKEEEKSIAEVKEKLDGARNCSSCTEVQIALEWKKNYTWGYCPVVYVWRIKIGGSITGYGYDKQSTGLANALNTQKWILKRLYQKMDDAYKKDEKAKPHDVLGYGSGYGIIPYFEGGVGISCHQRIIENVGLSYQHISGVSFDVFVIKEERK